jgi:hypothetical protein
VSFATITLCVASQRMFIVVVDFIIDSVWKLFDTPPYSNDFGGWNIHISLILSHEVKSAWNYSSTTPICFHSVLHN